MRPLTFENLEVIASATRKVVEFPNRDLAVTVRELTAAEFKRVQDIAGTDPNDKAANHLAQVLLCSIGICDANYDSDEGRERLKNSLPPRILDRLSTEIFELSAIDIGGIPKNLPGDGGSLSASASPLESSTPTT